MRKNLKTLILGTAASLLGSLALHAADTETQPFPGVRYVHRHTTEPREIDMHIVFVDLNQKGVTIKTNEPNGDKPGETTFETTSAFVARSKAQIGINSGFFGHTADGGADLVSLAVSDGVNVSDWGTKPWAIHAINIGADNKVTFINRAKDDTTGYMSTPKVDLYNALSGNARLLQDGKIIPGKGGNSTYPQTAIGHTADHRLVLFVSDGRQKFSVGMTYEEVATVLKEFGVVDAIAFDGGGSATMVMADGKGGEPKVLNRPSDGQERRVGNSLAVIITPQDKR
jgi:exopolysaccharide biosynthesis protein